MKFLQLVTGNKNKIAEYRQYAEGSGLEMELVALPAEIPERQSQDAETVLRSKIDFVRTLTELPFIVEDTAFFTGRYPRFPGTQAKFINETLGIDGWKRLFDEGDEITATTRIGLSNLGETRVFEGRLTGRVSFKGTGGFSPAAPINSIFFVPERRAFLGELISDPEFENHRKRACRRLFAFLKEKQKEYESHALETSVKWDERAPTWDMSMADPAFYVNHEDGYKRFSSVVSRFLPLLRGDVLDVACGTGAISKQIAGQAQSDVTGADWSGKMIELARENEKENLHFLHGGMDDIAPGRTFDAIVSRGILLSRTPPFFAADLLRQITALAKPGAHLIIDFLQRKDNGGRAHDPGLAEFSMDSVEAIMRELGWTQVFADGGGSHRVRIAAFRKHRQGDVYFVTGNPVKVLELNLAMKGTGVQLAFCGLEVDEIKADSIEKIVIDKASKAYAKLGKPAVCTDGGIFIDALGGFPGENSKQAAQKIGCAGILSLLKSARQRTAARKNCLAYFDGAGPRTLTMEIPCEISEEIRELYPAYELDKILIPISPLNPKRLTFAEIPVEDRVPMTELPQLTRFLASLLKTNKDVPDKTR